MNEKLRTYLEEFKKFTIEMIVNLKNDDVDKFEAALEKREQVIGKIGGLKFESVEFRNVCEELDIVNLDKELGKEINNEKNNLKEKILELKKSQSVSNAYYSNFSKINIFSKKV